jgi:uncharacterized protein YqeY
MSLRERLQADLKAAMKAGQNEVRDTLRLVLADAQRKEVDQGRDLDDEGFLAVLQKAVKSREDSIEQYTAAGRDDLAARERTEVDVIRRYLPEPLSDDDVHTIVRETIERLGVTSRKELGQVMKAVLAEYKGRVDGKRVQAKAAELLD